MEARGGDEGGGGGVVARAEGEVEAGVEELSGKGGAAAEAVYEPGLTWTQLAM